MTSGSTAIARAMHRRCCWPPDNAVPLSLRRSLTSSHRPARLSELLDGFVELGPRRGQAVDARTVGDVLEDRLRERVRLLEHHSDAGAKLDDVHRSGVDVLPFELDRAGHPRRRNRVVHAVEAAQERRFAAARRTDERGDAVVVDVDRDTLQGLLVTVEDVDVARPASWASRARSLRAGQTSSCSGTGGAIVGAVGGRHEHGAYQRCSKRLRR